MKTLQDVLTINLDTLETLLDRKTEASLRVALSSLDFRLWLQKWGISDHKLLREKRYTSHNVLCSMSRDEVNEVLIMIIIISSCDFIGFCIIAHILESVLISCS